MVLLFGHSVYVTLLACCRRMLIADRKSKVKEDQIGIVRADKLQITAADDAPEKLASNLHSIMQAIPDIVVAGISTVRRAVIQTSQKKDTEGVAPFCLIYVHSDDVKEGVLDVSCIA